MSKTPSKKEKAPAIKRREGRPTIYSQELITKICTRISLGESLRSICRDKEMPAMETIWSWLRQNREFSEQYLQSTRERSEAQHEDIAELGEKAIEHAEAADPKAANAIVNAYKLHADNLKWSMSKMVPKKYGNTIDITSDGRALPTPIYGGSSQNTIEPVKYITLEEKKEGE